MKKFLQSLLLLICIAVFLFSAWKLYGIWKEYQAGDEIYNSIRKQASSPDSDSQSGHSSGQENSLPKSTLDDLVNLNALLEINADTIGWIQIPDSAVNYPILQAGDNDKYLYRTITGESNKAGCIFADYRNQQPFADANTTVYGHNLLNGKMFNDLMNYEKKDWWKTHPDIYIQSENGTYLYQVYSCYRTIADSQAYEFNLQNNTEEFKNFLSWTLKQALYPTNCKPKPTDHIVTLSTCTNEEDKERFVVHAVLIK
ncbi:MAG: class B sortase [Lachnospiraceae bacterium]|nr:class B sortase [Lachnospiraceae bacterium]